MSRLLDNKTFIILLTIAIALVVITGSVMVTFDFDYKLADITIPDGLNVLSYSPDGSIGLASYRYSPIMDTDSMYRLLNSIASAYGIANAREELILSDTLPYNGSTSYNYSQYHNGIAVYNHNIKVLASGDGNYNIVNNLYSGDFPAHSARKTPEYISNLYAKTYQISVHFASRLYYPTDQGMIAAYYLQTSDISIIVDSNCNMIAEDDYITKGVQYSLVTQQKDFYGELIATTIEHNADETEYYLQDSIRNIYMYDSNGKQEYTSRSNPVKSANQTIDNGRAVSAFNTLVRSYDYYTADNVGTDFRGIGGKNDNTTSTVGERRLDAYVNFGFEYQNASYITNRRTTLDRIVLGNGVNNPRASLYETARSVEVVAHEYQHGITNTISQLEYVGESGAIDEALSDMFAAFISGQEINTIDFWLIGEDAVPTARKALRSMAYPEEFGDPSKYSDRRICRNVGHTHNISCDYNGVHSNSGIINNAFYQIWCGDTATYDAATLSKLIFNSIYKLTSQATFVNLYDALIATATELNLPLTARQAISEAFYKTGIITNTFSISYSPLIDANGTKPSNSKHVASSPFVIPRSDYSIRGRTLYAWQDTTTKEYYFVGQEYIMPDRNLTLKPIFLPSIWNDITPTKLTGSGQLNDPFLVTSATDLATVAYHFNYMEHIPLPDGYENGYFKQTADIDLMNINWSPIGATREQAISYSKLNYDGGGYSISNLIMSGHEDYDMTGLFGAVSGNLHNIHLRSSVINNYSITIKNSGSIVGYLTKGSLSNSSSSAAITDTLASYTARLAGGLVGIAIDSTISDSYYTGDIYSVWSGGIAGKLTQSVVINCYNSGKISGMMTGGIASIIELSSVINCINIGTILVNRNVVNNPYSTTSLASGIASVLLVPRDRASDYSSIFSGNKSAAAIPQSAIFTISGAHMIGTIYGELSDYKLHYTDNAHTKDYYLETISSNANLLASIRIGSAALVTSDSIYSGEFDFDSPSYYNNRNFTVTPYGGYYNSLNWSFNSGGMPTLANNLYTTSETELSGNGSQSSPYVISSSSDLIALSQRYYNDDMAGTSTPFGYYIITANIDMTGIRMRPIGSRTNAFVGDINGNGYTISNYCYDSSYYYSSPDSGGLFGTIGDKTSIANLNLNANIYSSDGGILAASISGDVTISDMSISGIVRGVRVGGLIGTINDGTINISNIISSVDVYGVIAGGLIGYTQCDSLNLCEIELSGDVTLVLPSSYSKISEVSIIPSLSSEIGGVIGWAECPIINMTSSTIISNLTTHGGNIGGLIGNLTTTTNTVINIETTTVDCNYYGTDSLRTYSNTIGCLDKPQLIKMFVHLSIMIGNHQLVPTDFLENNLVTTSNITITGSERWAFFYLDDEVISATTFYSEGDIIMPTLPYRVGHDQVAPYWELTSDTLHSRYYTAVYTDNVYIVTFTYTGIEGIEQYNTTEEYQHGMVINEPAPLPSHYLLTNTKWYDNNIVTQHRNYIIDVSIKTYIIDIIVMGKHYDSIYVEHGGNIAFPDISSLSGVIDVNGVWVGDTTNITSNGIISLSGVLLEDNVLIYCSQLGALSVLKLLVLVIILYRRRNKSY